MEERAKASVLEGGTLENKVKDKNWKTRAVIIRSSDEAWTDLIKSLETKPDCYLVFSKTSSLKLVIKEEGW